MFTRRDGPDPLPCKLPQPVLMQQEWLYRSSKLDLGELPPLVKANKMRCAYFNVDCFLLDSCQFQKSLNMLRIFPTEKEIPDDLCLSHNIIIIMFFCKLCRNTSMHRRYCNFDRKSHLVGYCSRDMSMPRHQ